MGVWTSSLYGRITVTSDAASTSMVHIYEDFPAGTWRLYRSVLPGTEMTGERPGNRLKFEVPGRELLSATQVSGGTDLHFEGVSLSIRNR
jgi:hypothetical protein